MPQENMSATARYPMEVKALGVLQHGRLKHNMFSVLWSDHNDMLIYRIFEDFKKLQVSATTRPPEPIHRDRHTAPVK
ncbi:hypothetical protein FKM82_023598 [Ascaphus truei]